MEQVILKNISNYQPVDGRPMVWIQPDAKIGMLRIDGMNYFNSAREPGNTPLIRADGQVDLLQVQDVVVQRPNAGKASGALVATSEDRSALKAFMDARAGIVNPGKGMRGWPEGYGYLTSKPDIKRLQLSGVTAENLEYILDHQAGTIRDISLDRINVSETVKLVNCSGGAEILFNRSTFKHKGKK